MKRLLSLMTIAAASMGASLQASPLAVPSELYLLPGRPMSLFTQAYLDASQADSHVRIDGSAEFSRRIPSVATLTAKPGDSISFRLLDKNFNPVDSCRVALLTASGRDAASPVWVQVLGDSFVQGAFYRTALVDSGYVPQIRTVGLRRLADCPEAHFDEGRGGFTLRDYFTVSKSDMLPYAGYMQPKSDMRYLGATGFWINCRRVMAGELKDFESRYQCGRFDDRAAGFDPATGLPLAPKKGDLLWQSDRNRFVCFDGKKWKETALADSDWEFNYPKYLAIWQLHAPDFLFETLGLNDFRNDLLADYSEWDSMVTTLKDSYLQANPKGKFAIVIPCSSCGKMENRRGDFTIFQNACMWRFRRHLIDTFDHRADEGFHLVDMGITIDNDHGYRTDAEGLQTGNPHPYPNYPEMGMPLAAFIQYHRH